MNNCERFGVTEEQLRALVAEGLRDGGDWCDLYFEDTSYHDLLLRDGVVEDGLRLRRVDGLPFPEIRSACCRVDCRCCRECRPS